MTLSILFYAHFILAILVIVLVFIQPNKAGLGNLLSSGGGLENKKPDFVTKFTLGVILSFIAVSACVVYIDASEQDQSIITENQIQEKEFYKDAA